MTLFDHFWSEWLGARERAWPLPGLSGDPLLFVWTVRGVLERKDLHEIYVDVNVSQEPFITEVNQSDSEYPKRKCETDDESCHS